MLVLMMIVAGMAVALAIYFLLSGVFSYEPAMEASTVNHFGILPSVIVFALCGPVLVLKLWFHDDGKNAEQGGFLSLLVTAGVAIFWSGTIGMVATQSVSAAIAPTIAAL